MIRRDGEIVAANDAVLVVNVEKNSQPNYIGGATFLEMFKAFELGRNCFLTIPFRRGCWRMKLPDLARLLSTRICH